MAYGSMLKKGTRVITSRDSSRSARMLKRAMMAGLNAAGVDVEDLEVASVPVTRFIVRRPSSAGGITIRLVHDDPQSVIIRFFDDRGLDITEDAQRKIERLFNREDFRRVFPGEIGDIGFAPAPSSTTPPPWSRRSTSSASGTPSSRWSSTTPTARPRSPCPTCWPSWVSRCWPSTPSCPPPALLRADLDEHALRVADLVRASGSHLGAVLDPDGERLRLIDDEGHVLSDTEALLALLSLLPGKIAGDKVALPVSTTQLAGGIVAAHGTEVVVTKLSNPALMDAATEPGVGFAGNTDGGFILPGFLPAFDAAATFIKMLDLLAHHGRRLSEVVAELPRPHLAHEVVVTPWEQKGTVMRTLVEQSKDREVELVDGVKVRHGAGWALALPDPEEPVTHVWAEADTDADARRLAQEYARRIRQMVR